MWEGEEVVVLNAVKVTDPYSTEDSDDWQNAPEELTVLTLAPPEPRPSDEPSQDARNSVTSGWTLYLPLDTPIDPESRIRVRGIDYSVNGVPASWYDQGLVVQATLEEG